MSPCLEQKVLKVIICSHVKIIIWIFTIFINMINQRSNSPIPLVFEPTGNTWEMSGETLGAVRSWIGVEAFRPEVEALFKQRTRLDWCCFGNIFNVHNFGALIWFFLFLHYITKSSFKNLRSDISFCYILWLWVVLKLDFKKLFTLQKILKDNFKFKF